MRLTLFTDARHAWRAIAARPAASAVIVLVVAIGVGLTAAMFALTDPYVLRPLPYAEPDRLVAIRLRAASITRGTVLPTLDDWRARTDLFTGVAATGGPRLTRLRLPDRTMFLEGLQATRNLFDVLGVAMPLDATWHDAAGDGSAVLLTASARPALPAGSFAIGAMLSVEQGAALRVAGIVPDAFLFPESSTGWLRHAILPIDVGAVTRVSAWTPEGAPRSRTSHLVIARLQPGVTPDIVAQALAVPAVSGSAGQESPLGVHVVPLHAYMTEARRPLALGALASGLLILLVCAANVANLWLVRGAYRTRELAVRAALGASRARLVSLMALEILVLTTTGGAAALLLASVVLAISGQVIPTQYVLFGAPAVTGRVVVFALLAVGFVSVTALVSGLLMRRAGTAATGFQAAASDGGRSRAMRIGFVAVQSALAMILAVGGAMLGQSYWNLVRQEPGFDTGAVAISAMYDAGEPRLREIVDQSVERLRRAPGVATVGAADGVIVINRLSSVSLVKLEVDGRSIQAHLQRVTPSFLEAAGMTPIAGRSFAAVDGSEIVVNEAFVREHWPGAPVVGRLVSGPSTIVGVVQDAYDRSFDEKPLPTVYRPITTRDKLGGNITYVLRMTNGVAPPEGAIRRALFDVHPGVVVPEFDTIGGKLARTVNERTFATLIIVFFSIAGAGVAVAGLVGIVGFVVARRTREIAIRMAIGAGRHHVRRLVAGEAGLAAIAGLSVGLVVGRWLSTYLESFVYGIEAGSWTTTVAAGIGMCALLMGAALWPARRAVNLSPSAALRVE